MKHIWLKQIFQKGIYSPFEDTMRYNRQLLSAELIRGVLSHLKFSRWINITQYPLVNADILCALSEEN